MANSYDPGNVIRISGTFTDSVSLLVIDPTVIVLKVKDAIGTVSSYTPTRDSTGQYHYDLTIPLTAVSSGYWKYSWEASGNVLSSSTDTPFQVRQSVFAL